MSHVSSLNVNTILVATDFSESAEAAFVQAMWFAQRCSAEVTLAHVLTDLRAAVCDMPTESRWQLAAGDIENFERELRRRSDEQLERQISSHRDGRVKLHHISLLGAPFVEIIHAVQKEKYDLVVTGTRGMSAIKRFILGSNAERLVRMCPCPVWVVKPQTDTTIRSLLVPVDFSDVSGRALRLGASLAACCNAKLNIIHAYDVPLEKTTVRVEASNGNARRDREAAKQSATDRLDSFLRKNLPDSAQPDIHVVRGEAWRQIDSIAKRIEADLVVMGTVGRSGIPGLLLGNTAEKVLRTGNQSVLVVKPEGFVCPIEPPFWSLHPAEKMKASHETV